MSGAPLALCDDEGLQFRREGFLRLAIPAYRSSLRWPTIKNRTQCPGFPAEGLNGGSTLITRNLNLVIFRVA